MNGNELSVRRVRPGRPIARQSGDASPVTFSFGENWKQYAGSVNAAAIEKAMCDIVEWLGGETVRGCRVLDIGCGSGIHSFCFQQGHAAEIVSFDVDPQSVEATLGFWRRAGRPDNWTVTQGSVLDNAFMSALGAFDVVYSWGVLHHTGSIWQAIDSATQRVALGGRFWLSLYTGGPRYPEHLALKQRYNGASWLGKKRMVWAAILRLMWRRLRSGKNPLAWNQRISRGMSVYHDLIDWLGGLPYEVADPDDTIEFCAARGFKEIRTQRAGEGGCTIYLFEKYV